MFLPRGAKVKKWVGIISVHILRSDLSFFLFLFPRPTGTISLIPTCGERKAGIRCRGDGCETKVPRVDTNHILSFARIFTLSILLVIMWTFLFLLSLPPVFLCFWWSFFQFLGLFIDFFWPRNVPGEPTSADFWSLSWICTFVTYFVALLHVHWTLWCDQDQFPCSGLDTK
jgi:hypothetical protein